MRELDAETATGDTAFSFWGASKRTSKVLEKAPPAITGADKSSGVDDATTSKDGAKLTKVTSSSLMKGGKKAVSSKLADRLKAFGEADVVAVPPPPPPAPAVVVKEGKDKKPSKNKDETVEEKEDSPRKAVPGSFPASVYGEDDIVAVVDMAPTKKDKKSRKSKAPVAAEIAPPPPPPPPPAPEPPTQEPTQPPEPKKTMKKDRPKAGREDSGLAAWGAAPVQVVEDDDKERRREERRAEREKQKMKSSKREVKIEDPPPTERKTKSRPAEKEKERSSRSKRSDDEPRDGSEKSSEKDKFARTSRPPQSKGFSGMFSTPISRSTSTRDKERRSNRTSSHRHRSVDVEDTGLRSPPPEMTSKAARTLGFSSKSEKVSRSKSERKRSPRGKSHPN